MNSTGYTLAQKDEFLPEFYSATESASKILICAHIQPDDDAIGSSLAMYDYLHTKYPEKKITVANSYPKSDRWDYFEHIELIQFGTEVADMLPDYDLLLVVDTGNYSRISFKPEEIAKSTIKKICIDNHETKNVDVFDLLCMDFDTTSITEMLYELFYKEISKIDKRIAELLLLGILGDTIWFTLNLQLNKVKVFDVVKRLLLDGEINLETFKEKFWLQDSDTFLMIQAFITNAKFYEIEGWPKFICSYVSREYMTSHNYSDTDIREGSIVYTSNYNKTMKDIIWGVTFYPISDGSVKVSLRSRPGGVDVNALAEDMSKGQGHKGASGMTFHTDGKMVEPSDAIEEFLEYLRNHKPVKYEE